MNENTAAAIKKSELKEFNGNIYYFSEYRLAISAYALDDDLFPIEEEGRNYVSER